MDKGSEYYKRYLNGDNEGLRLLIEAYSDGLLWYIHTYVQDINTAEDLMMEVFVKLGTKKPKDKGTGGFRTWLYTIGRNLALDYLRRHKKDPILTERQEAASEGSDPFTVYQKTERDRTLYRALERINGDHARVLWLYYFEGMRIREIAGALGKTVHAAESMMSRARRSLREELEKEGFRYEEL